MGLYAFGECLPYVDNRITLNHDKKDKWGRPLVAIDCAFRENEKAMHEDLGNNAKEMLEAAGFKNISVSNKISFPGNANHEMGISGERYFITDADIFKPRGFQHFFCIVTKVFMHGFFIFPECAIYGNKIGRASCRERV